MKTNLLLIFIFYTLFTFGQEPIGNIYWVQFNSKKATNFTLNNPEKYLSPRAITRRLKQNIAIDSTDLPVCANYIDSLKSLGFYVKHTSKWMNGAIAILEASINIDSILKPSFIANYELRKDAIVKSSSNKFSINDSILEKYYGTSFHQISMLHGELLHEVSKGDGVHIAIIDAGFSNADQMEVFDSLFFKNKILGTYDFVNPGNNVYNNTHYHGTAVFSIIGGNTPGKLIGAAPEASYWLLRSEDAPTEFPVEEDYWMVAAEYADSVGCDVINSSLGYTTFDSPKFNHSYSEFDGKTMRISKAANLAVEKGMVVVCSAGNSGNDSWKYISTPSEAEKVLSVAAVNSNKQIASFSSRGLVGEGYIKKPDVAAMGVSTTYSSVNKEYKQGNGTSFSSPIIAGMAACLIGLYPEKTAKEISDLIKSVGDNFPNHNPEYGYGIPNIGSIIDPLVGISDIKTTNETIIYPNPFANSFSIINKQNFEQLDLYSMNGVKIFTSKLTSDQINTFVSPIFDQLNKGIYIVVLSENHKFQRTKLIKL